MAEANELQNIQWQGFEVLRQCGVAERITLRREIFTVTDPVRDTKVLTGVIEVETTGHTRKFNQEEIGANITVHGDAVWVVPGKELTEADFRPALGDKIISPTLGTYVIGEIIYEDNMGRMNYEFMCMFSNTANEEIC